MVQWLSVVASRQDKRLKVFRFEAVQLRILLPFCVQMLECYSTPLHLPNSNIPAIFFVYMMQNISLRFLSSTKRQRSHLNRNGFSSS